MQYHQEIIFYIYSSCEKVNTYMLASKCGPNHRFSAHSTHYVHVQTHVTVKAEDPGLSQASIFLA